MVERTTIRIGAWRLEPETRLLSRGEDRHRLEPKMLDVLLLLVADAGRAVPRERLEVEVWSRAAIGTDLLNRTIWKLRRVLGDDADEPRYIETIPRVGYRLVAPVEPAGGEGADGPTDDTALRAPDQRPGPTARPGGPWTGGASRREPLRRSVLAGLGTATLAVLTVVWLVLDGRAGGDPGIAGPGPDLRIGPLTSSPGYESSPSLSPDGRWVAYQRYEKDSPSPSWDVVVQEVGSSELPKGIATSPEVDEYGPAWSTRGDSVAFVRGGAECRVMIAAVPSGPVPPGPPVEVATCAPDQGHELAWMPDGSLLVASSGTGQTLGLSRIVRPGGTREPLTHPPTGYDGDRSPHPSPDGSRIAFVRQRTVGVSDVHLLVLGDSTPTRLTHDQRAIGGLAWSPDGSSVVFSSTRGGTSRLWSVPTAGGDPAAWPTGGRNASSVTFGGDVMVYEEYFGDADLWTLDPRSGALEPWGGSARSEWAPVVSPDGTEVAFLSDRTGSAEVWVSPSTGGTPRRLTRLDGAQVDPPRWSPDGTHLLFAAALDGDFDIFAVPREGGPLRTILETPDDERTPEWWGDRLIFAANRTGTFELWMQEPGPPQAAVRLTRGGGFAPRTGPDGAYLYHARPDEAGVWRLEGPGGAGSRVWDGPTPGDWANWTPDGEGFLYLAVESGMPVSLVRFGATTADTLARIEGEAPSRAGVAVLPDGRILFGRVVRSESDLWIATGLGTR